MSKVVVMNHPLISHKLSIIRDKDTKSKEFRELLNEIASLMTFDICRDLRTKDVKIETPICVADCKQLDKDVILVPILRAGLGMVEGILNLIPTAKVGHIGLYRDEETHEPCEYYAKFPANLPEATVIVLDPMLATGGSCAAAITMIKKRGAKDIRYIGLVGAPEGVKRLQEEHPDIDIYLAALDEKLNENCYIVPGLGDCGDRLFGTK
jgi:uracil phosphoribosyltransferase